MEVKWHFLTILPAISEHSKWPKGSIPRNASMMYAEHVLGVNVDWSTNPQGGLQSNWARAFNKTACSHSLCSSPGVVQEQSKILYRSAGGGGNYIGGGGAKGRMEALNKQTMVADGRTGLANGWTGPANKRTKAVNGQSTRAE